MRPDINTSLNSTALGVATAPSTSLASPDGSRLLYGNPDAGVVLSWNDFQGETVTADPPAMVCEHLEIILNVTGEGTFGDEDSTWTLGARTGGYLLPGNKPMRRQWLRGQPHRFLRLALDRTFLQRTLAACDGALNPAVEAFIQNAPRSFRSGGGLPFTIEQEKTLAQVLAPPVPQGARTLWYQSKTLQLMIDFLFDRAGDDELFCDRQKRIARERVARVITLLERGLSEPPSLATIAKAVGCSPFYLSRTFSRETGMSIPQYLRRIRMEKAAELLATGKFNVTEVAMEVGYSSLSHFSQAFCQVVGCCPALYPIKPGHLGPRPAVPM